MLMLNRLAHTEHKYQGLIRTLALSWNHLSPTNRSHQSFPGNSDSERNHFTYFTMWHQKKPDVCVVTCNIICKKNFFTFLLRQLALKTGRLIIFTAFQLKQLFFASSQVYWNRLCRSKVVLLEEAMLSS